MTRSSTPRPAPSRHSASAASVAVVLDPDRERRTLLDPSAQRDVLAAGGSSTRYATAGRAVEVTDGTPKPIAAGAPSRERLDRRRDRVEQRLLRAGRRRQLVAFVHACRRGRPSPARIFVPPRSTPMTRCARTGAATIPPRMADGGEALPRLPGRPGKGQVRSSAALPERAAAERAARRRATAAAGSRAGAAGSVSPCSLLVLLLVVVWSVASFLSFRSGVERRERAAAEAGRRRPHAAGRPAHVEADADPACSAPTATRPRRARGRRRSDSIMLVHTDPRRHRLAYLSIPATSASTSPARAGEDQRRLPGRRPTLAMKTMQALTGLPLNHVASSTSTTSGS